MSPLCVELGLLGLAGLAGASVWPNSTGGGVHRFLTFDSGIAAADLNASTLRNYDFVWGSSGGDRVPRYRAQGMATSFYIPYGWAPNASETLASWQQTHPSWVLYKCDRVTPAWYSNLVGRNVPLDVTNPAVVQWQIETYARPAAARGFNVIAADMFVLDNPFHACGVFEAPGKWRQLYAGPPTPPPPPPPGPPPPSECNPPQKPTGCKCWWNVSDTGCACCDGAKCCQAGWNGGPIALKHECAKCKRPESDRRALDTAPPPPLLDFSEAQVGWLAAFRVGLANAGLAMALIPNRAFHGSGGRAWDDPLLVKLRASTDGILDEAGWTAWGSARTADPEFGNLTMHALDMQRRGGAYYSINECGAVGPVEDGSLRLWVVASYLMSKASAAALFISSVQGYGRLMSRWPEMDVPIGSPVELPRRAVGVWTRRYTNGTVYVNAAKGGATAVVALPAGSCFRNVNGSAVPGHSIALPPLTASVLTFAPCG